MKVVVARLHLVISVGLVSPSNSSAVSRALIILTGTVVTADQATQCSNMMTHACRLHRVERIATTGALGFSCGHNCKPTTCMLGCVDMSHLHGKCAVGAGTITSLLSRHCNSHHVISRAVLYICDEPRTHVQSTGGVSQAARG